MANAFPLLLAAGMGAVLLSKKKPTSKKKGGSSSRIVDSGKVERTSIPKSASDNPLAYEWRVRSTSDGYVAEVGRPETLRDLVVKMWKAVGDADTVEDARDMALAWIDQQPGYEQPVNVVDSGAESLEHGDFEWRVITDPQRGHVGQYRIYNGPWLSAVEAMEYTQEFKMRIWDAAIKDLKRVAEEFSEL
jgi:hypothetical protein